MPVIIHNREKVFQSHRLYNGLLIDIDGNIIQKWKNGYLGVFSGRYSPGACDGFYCGQLGYELKKWGKYTFDDKSIWEKDEAIHHEIVVLADKIITMTKECQKYRGRLVDFDVIVEYNLDGNLLSFWSTWANLKYLKKFHPALELDLPKFPLFPELVPAKPTTPWGGNYDYYRINSLQVIPENVKNFMAGCWLITIRHGSMVFILDQNKKIVWKLMPNDVDGGLQGPHGAQILPNGNMLIFDNGRYRKKSRVIEIDPLSKKIIWQYSHEGFFTLSQGYALRLPNGNTLITESEKGHAFEVTLEGQIVWEFLNPQIQNEPNYPETQGTRKWIYRMLSILK